MSRLTGSTRETITKKLAGLPFTHREDMAKVYDAKDALRTFFLGEGRATTPREALDEKRVEQIDLEMEIKRKERVPTEDVIEHYDKIFHNIAGILKATLNKVMTQERLEDIFAELRRLAESTKGFNVKPVEIDPML